MGLVSRPNGRTFDFVQLEDQSICDVPLFKRRLVDIKLARLTVVVGEAFRPDAQLVPFFMRRERPEAGLMALARSTCGTTPGIRFIVDAALWIHHGHVPVLLKVMEGAFRRVDRNVREIWTAQALQL